MTSHRCRLVTCLFPFVTPAVIASGQGMPRFDAGAGAGGSAFGWQPQLGLGAETPGASLGSARLTVHGSFARVQGSSGSQLLAGARLGTAPGDGGWWMAADVVRRTGVPDLVEQPRISTGGWRRIGPLTIAIAASRRSAQLSTVRHFARDVLTYVMRQDSLSGQWDSIPRLTSVADSAATSAGRLWAETEGTLLWEAQRWSAQLTAGGRFATHDVPAGAWAGGELAVRILSPLSLVLGAGTASGSRFVLDAEHRYFTVGFRVRPRSAIAETITRSADVPAVIGPLGIEPTSVGQYRLSLWAPRAHSVELSGDFTGWQPVMLARGEGGEWSVSLALVAGTHRVNARIDGGAWIVPPGLTAVSDDFAGNVGVLVVEGEGGARK
jgi:hypothetical protein